MKQAKKISLGEFSYSAKAGPRAMDDRRSPLRSTEASDSRRRTELMRPADSPGWTRYIDSRMKQFVTMR